MQPTYIPEIKSGSQPGTAELINVKSEETGSEMTDMYYLK